MSLALETWPTNPGAYRRFAPSVMTASLVPFVLGADVSTVAAVLVAAAGDVGLLLAPPGTRGIRRHLKTAIVWAAWALSFVLLALAQFEGEAGVSISLGSLWTQLDATDVAIAGWLLLKVILQSALPNAIGILPTSAREDALVDMPEPPRHPEHGDALEAEPTTGLFSALTPEQIDDHLAGIEAASRGSAPGVELDDVVAAHVPAPAPAPEVEQVAEPVDDVAAAEADVVHPGDDAQLGASSSLADILARRAGGAQ